MATDAIESIQIARMPLVRSRGVVDRLLTAVDSLPGPAALSWLLIGTGLALIGHLILWSLGGRPIGFISHDTVAPALIFAWFGWHLHTLNRVATSSFNDFRPALGDPASEERYLAELTTIRDRDAVLGAAVAMAVVSVAYYAFVRPTRGLVPPDIELVSTPLWGLFSVVLGTVVIHTIRQLRLVSRLSAAARNVDIFKPASLNSFARLTSVSAVGLIAFVVAFVLFSPEQPLPYIIQESAVLLIAAASFILPLRVMHDRLVAEKRRLIGESQDRLKQVLGNIHQAVDTGDLAHAEQLNHTLTAVLAEQNVLNNLHTWPWSTATIRGFASALLLPIALIVLTQVIDKVL